MTAEEAIRNLQLNKQDEIERIVKAVATINLPEPGLWTDDEFEAVRAETSLAAAAIPRTKLDPVMIAPDASEEGSVDLTDPLKHIRELILPDCPKAAFASDEELELIYDDWQAKQEE